MGPSTLVMRKELNGYAKYGADGSADVVYEGEVENWTFQVPNVAIANATLAMSISADDHPSVARGPRVSSMSIQWIPGSHDQSALMPSQDLFFALLRKPFTERDAEVLRER